MNKQKIKRENKLKEIFNKVWNKSWYDKQSFSEKISGDIETDEKSCARFFETLVEMDYIKGIEREKCNIKPMEAKQ